VLTTKTTVNMSSAQLGVTFTSAAASSKSCKGQQGGSREIHAVLMRGTPKTTMTSWCCSHDNEITNTATAATATAATATQAKFNTHKQKCCLAISAAGNQGADTRLPGI
jgi:hypothetical protein